MKKKLYYANIFYNKNNPQPLEAKKHPKEVLSTFTFAKIKGNMR